jgi:hypothetical protein
MGGSSTTTQRADPWKPAQPFIMQGLQDASALYDRGGFEIAPYGGQMVASRDPLSQAAYGGAMGAAQAGIAGIGGAMGAAGAAMDPNQQSAQFGQVVQNTIDRVMPGINASFAGSGMTGSGLHARNLAQGVSAGVADTLNQNWQANQSRALQAAGMMPGLAQGMFGTLGSLNEFGREQQQQSQSEINAEVLRDQQRQTAELSAIQDYLSLTSSLGGQFGTQTQRQSQNMGLLGALGFGLQAAPLLFSDRRVKEDVKRVGETDEGLPVYTYRYKGGDTVHMGVMAQDVQKKKPEAVHNVGGLLAVDYGAI